MASIKNIYQCPKCKESITSDVRPEECPSCKYEFRSSAGGFKAPMTLNEQREGINPSGSQYTDALLDLPLNKAVAMMNDALNIIETISGKNLSLTDIRPIVEIAIRIGKVGTAYEEFLRAGGKHVPSLYITTDKLAGEENDQKTRNGAQLT